MGNGEINWKEIVLVVIFFFLVWILRVIFVVGSCVCGFISGIVIN